MRPRAPARAIFLEPRIRKRRRRLPTMFGWVVGRALALQASDLATLASVGQGNLLRVDPGGQRRRLDQLSGAGRPLVALGPMSRQLRRRLRPGSRASLGPMLVGRHTLGACTWSLSPSIHSSQTRSVSQSRATICESGLIGLSVLGPHPFLGRARLPGEGNAQCLAGCGAPPPPPPCNLATIAVCVAQFHGGERHLSSRGVWPMVYD